MLMVLTERALCGTAVLLDRSKTFHTRCLAPGVNHYCVTGPHGSMERSKSSMMALPISPK